MMVPSYNHYLPSLNSFTSTLMMISPETLPPFSRWLKPLLHKLLKSFAPKSKKSKMSSPLCRTFASMDLSNQLKLVFDFIDSDGDGKISSLELSELLASLGCKKSSAINEAEQIVREADCNDDGFIDFVEFMGVVGREDGRELHGSDEDLAEAFRVFDADKNGFISAEEIRRVLVGLGEGKCSLSKCRLMVRGVDKNGDGLVDFHEFRSMMTGF